MANSKLIDQVYDRLVDIPLIDAHTHLISGSLGATGLHDIMLYHMSISDLYAAGCPSGSRLTQYPGRPSDEEAEFRILEALPYLRYVRNTAISYGIKIILRDLYGITESINQDNWRYIDGMIRERARDHSWHREVARRASIERFCTELARREQGQDDDILTYTLEWAFFTRCQWGEYDTALYELERCWGKLPENPTPIGLSSRPAPERVIRSVEDVREAVEWYVDHIPIDQVRSIATHISTDIDFAPVSETEMQEALARREIAGPRERDIYASYVNELFLSRLEEKIGDSIIFQFSFGAEPLPFETASRLSQKSIAQVADMISRHPGIRFQCFLSSRHANQSMCTLARELPNLSLAGYWWHNFFPGTIRQIIEERLDMLPVNKQIGFFSDAYCVEWAYAKTVIVRQQLAVVLADKIATGQYTMEDAVDIASEILYRTPVNMLRLTPAIETS